MQTLKAIWFLLLCISTVTFGRGIGEATARKLASHGARVLVNDLDADVAEAVAASIPGAVAFPADLTDPAAKGD